MRKKWNRILALTMALAMALSLCVPWSLALEAGAAAAESGSSSGAAAPETEDAGEAEAAADAADSKDSEETEGTEAAASGENSSEAESGDAVSAVPALAWLVVVQPNLSAPDTQQIVAGFAEDTRAPESAALTVCEESTGTLQTVEAAVLTEGAAEFDLEYAAGASGSYRAERLSYTYDGVTTELNLTEIGIEARYGVDTEVETEPDEVLSTDDDCGIELEVSTLSEDGELETADSLEEALAAGDALVSEDADAVNDGGVSAASDTGSTDSDSGNVVVVLDPGHDATHTGAQSGSYQEEVLSLKIAQYCKEALEEYAGVTVYMTRTTSACAFPNATDPETGETGNSRACLFARVDYAASVDADYFVSIHLNAGGGTGAEVYYPNENYATSDSNGAVQDGTDLNEEGEELSQSIMNRLTALGIKVHGNGAQSEYSDQGKTYDDGSDADDYLVIRESKKQGICGIIVEHCYLDSSDADTYLSSDAKLQALGEADAEGIADYLELKTKEEADAETKVDSNSATKTETSSAANPFTDVASDAYYYDAVLWAYENGITTGITETTFCPSDTCTRAQAVTFLWRSRGEPEPESTANPFADISESAYYYKAVLWAYENGVTTGTADTDGTLYFDPTASCTRGQIVTFLYRAEGEPEYTVSNPFTDVASDSAFYDAILWAYENGITNGLTETAFGPSQACTRAQIVTFLYRCPLGCIGTTLAYGDSGDEVKHLQERLTELGYYATTADASFGNKTEAAVIMFQAASGLELDESEYGTVEEKTLALLNSRSAPTFTSCQNGSTGTAVYRLQKYLIQLYYLLISEPDSSFGSKTQAAIEELQSDNGLTVTGVADQATLTVLYNRTTKAHVTEVSTSGTLDYGDTGDEVTLVQRRLRELGYFTVLPDGGYGVKTEASVIMFQAANEMDVSSTSFGIVESWTVSMLNSSSAVACTTYQNGSTGTAVYRIQKYLIDLGYLAISEPDSSFGSKTQAALEAFQGENGLEVTGIADQATLTVLYNRNTQKHSTDGSTISQELSYGDTGDEVTLLQERLIALGYLTGSASGTYDAETQAAVVAFQGANDIAYSTVRLESYGSVDEDTLTALNSSDAAAFSELVCDADSESNAVKVLQIFLRDMGYLTDSPDGTFDDATQSALLLYQETNGLTQSGTGDLTTLLALYNPDEYNTLYLREISAEAENAQAIWDALIEAGLTEAGAAGLMGNLYSESRLNPTDLQGYYNTKLGMTDDEYTAAVSDGTYTEFATDSAGYGLAQWTYHTRKQALYDYYVAWKETDETATIGDLDMQLGYLVQELQSDYSSVWKTLTTTDDLLTASNQVMMKFEVPADQGCYVQVTRAGYGLYYLNLFGSDTESDEA